MGGRRPSSNPSRPSAPYTKRIRNVTRTDTNRPTGQKDARERITELIQGKCRIQDEKESREELHEIINEMIKELAEGRMRTAYEKTTGEQLQSVNLKLDELLNERPKLTGAPVSKPTYAQAAARAAAAQPSRKENATPQRKAREMIVRFNNAAEAKTNRTRTVASMLDAISKQSPEARQDIVSLRRLPSGDVALRASCEEARLKMEGIKSWVKGLGESAELVRNTYAVLAHGVPLTLNTKDQKAAIAKLQEENSKLHPGLEVIRMAWPKSAKGKTYSSLIIEVATAAQANRILYEGIVIGYTECNAELFEKGCRMMQCFNCYGFGHVAKACRAAPSCHKCEGSHQHTECTRSAGDYCANCKTKGHKPWQQKCPVWQKEKTRKDLIYKSRPSRFIETHANRTRGASPTTDLLTPPLPTPAPPTPSITIQPTGPMLSGIKRKASFEKPPEKRRPGRPKGTTIAGAAHTQSTLGVTGGSQDTTTITTPISIESSAEDEL